jgi:hypothetical protein
MTAMTGQSRNENTHVKTEPVYIDKFVHALVDFAVVPTKSKDMKKQQHCYQIHTSRYKTMTRKETVYLIVAAFAYKTQVLET